MKFFVMALAMALLILSSMDTVKAAALDACHGGYHHHNGHHYRYYYHGHHYNHRHRCHGGWCYR